MRRRLLRRAPLSLLLVAAAALASGCDGGGSDAVNFNAFVKGRLAATSDTAEPVDVNGLLFTTKPGDDAPAAFDDVLGVASDG